MKDKPWNQSKHSSRQCLFFLWSRRDQTCAQHTVGHPAASLRWELEATQTGGDFLAGKKKKKQNYWLPAFLSTHTTRGKLSLRCARSLAHSGFCRPRRPLYRSPAPAAGLEEPQPEWVTGFTSVADWPLLSLPPLSPAASHVSVSAALPTASRRTDMEVFWARSGKRHHYGCHF